MIKQKAIVLFSGGRDSSFVALLLDSLGYDVTLVTANAGISPNSWKTAAKPAKILGFPHELVKVEKYIYEEAAKIAEKDGFPLNAIKHIHLKVIEAIAHKYHKTHTTIADGTRRDDRTPRLTYPEMQSLEDRYKISYVAPLLGFGHKAVNHLSDVMFEYDKIWTGKKPTAEYEIELRLVLEKRKKGIVKKIFPKNHFHSVVTKVKKR
ncbi:TPA: hypothetical protein H1009_03875 [archaeon]|nr:hypothetical protein [Candidatus Naiadarchaeales archaeon SRR2090153.bin461]